MRSAFFKSPACTAVRPTPRLDILLGETFKRGFTVKRKKNGRWRNRRVRNDTLGGFFFLKREDVTIFLTFINSIESNPLLNIFIYGISFKEKKNIGRNVY